MPACYRILESKVICRQPGRYIGWPTIARTRDGELLVAFSGDRDAHVCPFGKSMLVRSFDDGRRWGGAELINDTPLDDRDTGLCACRDGTLVMSWFTSHYTLEVQMERVAKAAPEVRERWRRQVESVTGQDILQWAGPRLNPGGRYELGHWTRRSTDGGRTWEPPVRVPPDLRPDGKTSRSVRPNSLTIWRTWVTASEISRLRASSTCSASASCCFSNSL